MARKNEWKFIAVSIVLGLLVLGVIFYALQFLTRALYEALNTGLMNKRATATFNLGQLKELGIKER